MKIDQLAPKSKTNETEYMTVKELAQYLNLPTGTIYGLVQSRNFPAIRIGKQWRISKKRFEKWFDEKLESK